MEKQTANVNTDNGANKKLVLRLQLGCGSQSITTPVSLLANEFDVQSILHGQVSLAAVDQIYVIHEVWQLSIKLMSFMRL